MPGSPVIARADALMYRQREGEPDPDIPVLTEIDDDIPVLCEIEAAPGPISVPPDETPSTAPVALLDEALVRVLAEHIEARLALEIPRLIESTVRDFLAEQAMISGNRES